MRNEQIINMQLWRSEYELDAVISAEIGDPVPGEHAFDADDQIILVLIDHLQESFGRCLDIFVNQLLSAIIEDTDIE